MFIHERLYRYGDAVMEIDFGVGQIMTKLREHKMEKNTFAFFSSDNGAATYAFTEGIYQFNSSFTFHR